MSGLHIYTYMYRYIIYILIIVSYYKLWGSKQRLAPLCSDFFPFCFWYLSSYLGLSTYDFIITDAHITIYNINDIHGLSSNLQILASVLYYLMFNNTVEQLYLLDEIFFFFSLSFHPLCWWSEATGRLTSRDEHLAGVRLTECLATQDRHLSGTIVGMGRHISLDVYESVCALKLLSEPPASEVTDSSSTSFLEFFPVETIPPLISVCQQSLTFQPLNSPLTPNYSPH